MYRLTGSATEHRPSSHGDSAAIHCEQQFQYFSVVALTVNTERYS